MTLNRRQFLGATAATSAAVLSGCAARSRPAAQDQEWIDCHAHFYDPTRPAGVPWPPRDDAVLYRAVYPSEFNRLASPFGITGTVVVEASPWVEDNQWILDLAQREPSIVGFVGQLTPGRPEFAEQLQRFVANPLYRGLRLGAWDRSSLSGKSALLRDLGLLVDHDLALDVLINTDRLPDISQLAAALPALRIVIDHCANVRVDGAAPPAAWLDGLATCAAHPNVFMKVSGLVEGTGRSDGSAPVNPALYRPTLDAIWERFGEDRVLYGSNWPVSTRFAPYEIVFRIVEEYFSARGAAARLKYFRNNAAHVYKFIRR